MEIVRNLLSAKQVGILYHYTSPYNMGDIVRTGFLVGRRPPIFQLHPDGKRFPDRYGVSFTRDKNFHRYRRSGVPMGCRLVLDGDKMSGRVKFVPHDYYYDNSDPDGDLGKDPRLSSPKCPGYGVCPDRWGKRPTMDEMEEIAILAPGKEALGGILGCTYKIEYASGFPVEYYDEDTSEHLFGKEALNRLKGELQRKNYPHIPIVLNAYKIVGANYDR